MPYSNATRPACSAATCAANGVDLREPLKPCAPEDDADSEVIQAHGRIVPAAIDKELSVSFLRYSMSVIVARALPVPPRLFLIPDAIGLALFTIVGTQVALQWHTPWLAASLMGVITGVLGGVLRDILCNDVPTVFLKGELYASAAWLGALALIILQEAGFHAVDASWMAMAIVLGLRLCAIHFHLTLPAFRPRRDD